MKEISLNLFSQKEKEKEEGEVTDDKDNKHIETVSQRRQARKKRETDEHK
jgi:hypothetical protein